MVQGTAGIVIERTPPQRVTVPRRSRFGRIFRRLSGDPVGLVAGAVLLLIVLSVLTATLIAPDGPYSGSIADRLQEIGTAGHVLGTDQQGRDIFSRIRYGGRISLLAGVLPVLVATLIGGTLGAIAGHFGGLVGGALMRTMDVFYAFPAILLAIGIAAALGPGLSNAVVALAVVFIPPLARVTETAVRNVEARLYMEAARASGAGNWRTIARQVLPNVAVPVGVYA
ncbi:MAG: ABC transporter permease, partial [Dehalococcoidia bacterium]